MKQEHLLSLCLFVREVTQKNTILVKIVPVSEIVKAKLWK